MIYFWSIFGSEIDQKSIKNRSKNKSKTTCKLGWILDRSWIDFWSIWGPSWGSSWGQVGTKIGGNGVPKRCQKIIKNLETQGHAVVPQWSGVQAPKESLRDPLILEYKSTSALRACALGTLLYRARGPGADPIAFGQPAPGPGMK